MSVPQEKLVKIIDMCKKWENKCYCSKQELQSLLGSLLYISKCVRAARIFLCRMLHSLRCNHGKNSITLDNEFKKDLMWFNKFLPIFNGKTFFNKRHPKATIELDASLSGLGARFGAKSPDRNMFQGSIVHLEMLNILVALRLWHFGWKGAKIVIYCDNQTVVSVLNSGKYQDQWLAAIARNILFMAAIHDIDLRLLHVLGKNNSIADTLSRWTGSIEQVSFIQQQIPNCV